jgi:large subunit ribosomal protein L25
MKSVPLKAYPRSQTRRSEVKKLRESGRVPATIYGRLNQAQNLELNAREFDDVIHRAVSENLLIDLAVESDAKSKRLALLQEVQHHPVTRKVLHVDFHEVAEDEKVTVMVPVETEGIPAGVKTGGGILEHVVFKLKVRSLPKDLPEVILVDVSALEIGKSIHLSDLKAPEGVELLGDKHVTIASVAIPRAEVETATATAEAAAAGDVEMINEKKDEEGGAAAAKGDAKSGDKKAGAPSADAKAGDKKAEVKPDAKAAKKK